MTHNTNNATMHRLDSHKMIDPALHKKFFNYVLRSNKNDTDGQWTTEKIISILNDLNLTNKIEGLDLKTENIHSEDDITTYKHFEISFKDEEGYLKFLHSGYTYRDRTVFPYPKEDEDRPMRRPTNDRQYYINVTNVPLGAELQDIDVMIRNHIDETKIKYNILNIRNIKHQINSPPIQIKTGHWEISITTKEPLRPKDNPNHRINNMSLFFSRKTPVNVLANDHETTLQEIKEGKKKPYKRYVNFTIPQLNKNITEETIVKNIKISIQDKEAHKYITKDNLKITIKDMPHINKNSADITIDRRLQAKMNLTLLTTNMAAVRPTVGKFATDFDEADRLFTEQKTKLTGKNNTIVNKEANTNDQVNTINMTDTNMDTQNTNAMTETSVTEENEQISTASTETSGTNETEQISTASTETTETEETEIQTPSTYDQTNDHISNFTTSEEENSDTQSPQNPYDGLIDRKTDDETKYRTQESTGETDGGREGGSEMRTGATSPSMLTQTQSTQSDEIIPPTQHSQMAIKNHKNIPYASVLNNPPPSLRKSPTDKLSTMTTLKKNKRHKNHSDEEDKTIKRIKISELLQRTDTLQIADSHIDLTTEEQLIQDMTDIENNHLQINRNSDRHKTALATTIVLNQGMDIYTGQMTDDIVTGIGALLYVTHGKLKDEHTNQKHISQLPKNIIQKWMEQDKKQTKADIQTRTKLIHNLIDKINDRSTEMTF